MSGLGKTLGDPGMYAFGAVTGGLSAKFTGGDFWQGAATGLMVTGLNHMRHGITPKGAKMMAKLYKHYQVGRNQPFEVDVNDLNFSMTSQEELGLSGMEVDEVRLVDLFKTGYNETSLPFGSVYMRYHGNNEFSIEPNDFDFNYERGGSFKRNLETLGAGLIFGRVYDHYVPILHPFFHQPNLFFGGPFPVIFNGTVTIK